MRPLLLWRGGQSESPLSTSLLSATQADALQTQGMAARLCASLCGAGRWPSVLNFGFSVTARKTGQQWFVSAQLPAEKILLQGAVEKALVALAALGEPAGSA